MLKKTLAVLCAALTLFTLAGCGGSSADYASLDLEKAAAAIDATGIYPATMIVDDQTLSEVLQIDPAKLEKHMVAFPLMNVHASLYMALLPKAGEEDNVRAEMEAYLTTWETSWQTYLPDQYQLVQDRTVEEIETAEGTWLVCIISTDNDAVLEALKSGLTA